MNEFELIRRYFDSDAANRVRMERVCDLGNGDDCAILGHLAGRLAISSDTVVVGRHVPQNSPAAWLASRGLAAAVSDLAAVGARPLAFTLALTLPSAQAGWLNGFSRQLFASADSFDIALIGGDVTRGPLTASFTVFGEVPRLEQKPSAARERLARAGARVGDAIWVTGQLGAAAAALPLLHQPLQAGHDDYLSQLDLFRAYVLPQPRIDVGLELRSDPAVHAAIDISDGLLADIRHIADASEVTVRLDSRSLPIAAAVKLTCSPAMATRYALCGGDDYELLFTTESDWRPRQTDSTGLQMTCIGVVCERTPNATQSEVRADPVFVDDQPAASWLKQSAPAGIEGILDSSGGFRHFD